MGEKYKEETLKGTSIHYLTLKERTIDEKSQRYWKCECVCGNTRVYRQDFLLRGVAKSCGCKHPRRLKGSKNGSWRGCGDICGQYYGHLQRMAKIRNVSFDVSLEFLWELFLKQDHKCALTGTPLVFHTHQERMAGITQTASLDRKDSSKGYTEDNVQWVHSDVNVMKNDFSEERFVEVCRLVAARHPTEAPTRPCTESCSSTMAA